MSIEDYQAKRKFDRTPEPRPAERAARGPLRFVVQQHRARRLHYDFRLELEGVLKSWAVPKGPSLVPGEKRLAVMVEDHPLDYGDFEGVIPKGNYGAGTVMIWDRGVYCARESPDRDKSERLLLKGLEEGKLTFVLQGQKLRGEFVLTRLKRAEQNAWLLIKKTDSFASKEDVLSKDRSAATGRSLDEIADEKSKTWTPGADTPLLDLSGAPKAKLPRDVKPMLAQPVDRPFDRTGWLFEIKWDGYRAIGEVEQGKVRLYSRRNLSFETKYPSIVASLKKLTHDAVLDGEIVVLDPTGRADFSLLQKYQQTGQGALIYQVFDLLHLDGHDLRGLPLWRRKKILQQILGFADNVRLSEHIEEHGTVFFHAAVQRGLEGVVAKRADSAYHLGRRGDSWLKIKARQQQEAVIGGFTEPRGSRRLLGSLILGVYDGDDLAYIGRAGGGFTDRLLEEVHAKLAPLVQTKCPFKEKPKTDTRPTWVRPELVCEVNFLTWGGDGHVREPIFMGLREDKAPREVRREVPRPVSEVIGEAETPEKGDAETRRRADAVKNDGHAERDEDGPVPASPRPRVPASVPKLHGKQLNLTIDGKLLHLTNLDKVFWPEEGYTKGDVIRYYRQVAPFVLPYLKDRPESLNRHPNGWQGKNFFQKNAPAPSPGWAEKITLQSSKRSINYLLCQDEATLVYLANLGCIELNPWSSRVGALDRPDFVILDLDPIDLPYDRVVEAALAIRKALDQAGAESVAKTSGKRGMHIYVPLGAKYDYDHGRRFAEIVARLVTRQLPELASVARLPAQRQQRVYLDFLQNRRSQTLAAPYSIRPVAGARVSTPLKWSEVKKGLDPSAFTIATMPKRLDKVGDLWQPVLGPGVDLQACLDRLVKQVGKSEPEA